MIRRPCSGFCEAAHTCQRFSPYRSTGPGIGAAAWAAQDAQGGEPGATCGHEADADFEQDEQPPGEADFEQDEQCRQPARPTTSKTATIPNKRFRNMRVSFLRGPNGRPRFIADFLPATPLISTLLVQRSVRWLTTKQKCRNERNAQTIRIDIHLRPVRFSNTGGLGRTTGQFGVNNTEILKAHRLDLLALAIRDLQSAGTGAVALLLPFQGDALLERHR